MKDTATSWYSSHFNKYGISSENVAKASLYFLGIGAIYFAGLWGTCFTLRPTQNLVRVINWPRLHQMYAKVLTKTEKGHGRAAEAFAEAIVMKGVLAPISIPIKVWLAVKLATKGQPTEPQ